MDVTCATEVWVATARLHQEHPERDTFKVQEIVDKAQRLALTTPFRAGVILHASQHCVANKNPNPANLRMLIAGEGSQRRLFREGDSFHPLRAHGKTKPAEEEIPEEHRELLEWYEEVYATGDT